MSRQRNHHLSNWLYHTTFFTRFYERMAGRFSIDVLWDDFQIKFLNQIPNGGTLLEIGAGPGLLALQILESRPNLKIFVTDYSPEMLNLARANLMKASRSNREIAIRKAQLEYVQADAMDLSEFADRKIDGVYSMGAIKHFPEPLVCLKQASNILSNNGIMYFSDSCADGKYSGTKEIVAKLRLSPIASTLLCPVIHLGLKRESPSAAEVRSWVSDFGNGSMLNVDFSWGGSTFTLTYQKNDAPSANEHSS